MRGVACLLVLSLLCGCVAQSPQHEGGATIALDYRPIDLANEAAILQLSNDRLWVAVPAILAESGWTREGDEYRAKIEVTGDAPEGLTSAALVFRLIDGEYEARSYLTSATGWGYEFVSTEPREESLLFLIIATVEAVPIEARIALSSQSNANPVGRFLASGNESAISIVSGGEFVNVNVVDGRGQLPAGLLGPGSLEVSYDHAFRAPAFHFNRVRVGGMSPRDGEWSLSIDTDHKPLSVNGELLYTSPGTIAELTSTSFQSAFAKGIIRVTDELPAASPTMDMIAVAVGPAERLKGLNLPESNSENP